MTLSSSQDTNKLSCSWTLWTHSINNNDWSLKSYQKLVTISTLDEYAIMNNHLPNLHNSMYFLMKDGYRPLWDVEENKNGMAYTFKVNKHHLTPFWITATASAINGIWGDRCVGISISPKLKFVTVRIWISDTSDTPLTSIVANHLGMANIDFNYARKTYNSPNHK